MEEVKEIAGETLFFLSPEVQILCQLSSVVMEMEIEFYQFKAKNPDNAKVPAQEKRLEKIREYIGFLEKSSADCLSLKEEIGRLKWALTNQLTVIKEREAELSEAKGQIESLKKQLEF